MPWRTMKLLAKSFEDSSCAAARFGPKIRSPAAWKASTMPAASAASGPTTVRETCSFFANATSSAMSLIGRFSRPDSSAVPPLPGATNTFCTRGLEASFHAIACSRPPPPMTRSFMSMPEVAHAGKDHRSAALVGRSDDFGVAHAAARLDHGACAGVEQHLHAIAEREKGVRSNHGILQGESGRLRLHGGQARAVDAAHLPGADAERRAAAAEDDRIG